MRQGVLIGAAALAVGAGSSVSFGQMFDTVINIGTGQADGTTFDGSIGSNTQLNLFEGGRASGLVVGIRDQAVVNTEANIYGGEISSAVVENGAILNTFGGVFDFGVISAAGGTLNAHGGEFQQMTTVNSGSMFHATGGVFQDRIQIYSAHAEFGGDVEVFDRIRAWPSATVEISGGFLPDIVAAQGTVTRISGGFANIDFSQFGGKQQARASLVVSGDAEIGAVLSIDGSQNFDISGGRFLFEAELRGDVQISGGSFAPLLVVGGGIANIEGGTFEQGIRFLGGGPASVSSGLIGEGFQMVDGSSVNLIGTEFFINGIEIDIDIGETQTITRRAAFLSGLLEDGSAFDIGMRLNPQNGLDFVSRDATLTITRVVPAPGVLGLAGVVGLFAGRRRR